MTQVHTNKVGKYPVKYEIQKYEEVVLERVGFKISISGLIPILNLYLCRSTQST